MKISKMLHVGSVVSGLAGVITFIGTLIGGGDNLVFGITKMDGLACAGILMLMAVWFVLGAIHHMMLEKKGEIV